MEPGQYDPEDIRKWKDLIYGQNWAHCKVGEWASTSQDPRMAKRVPKRTKKPSFLTNSSSRSGGSNHSSSNSPIPDGSFSNSSSHDDWLHSPISSKRNYRISGSPRVKSPSTPVTKTATVSSPRSYSMNNSFSHDDWLHPVKYNPKRNRIPPKAPLW